MTRPDDGEATEVPDAADAGEVDHVDGIESEVEQADVDPQAPDQPDEAKGLQLADPSAAPTRDEVDALRRERDELHDQLLRKRADLENFRKRVQRDRQLVRLEAVSQVFRGLLPTLDGLDKALSADDAEGPLKEGVKLIQRDLWGLLEAEGVAAEHPEGETFDPERHQALVHESAPGFEEGTIVEVFRKGYRLKDRLLRPALVKVAKKSESAPDDGIEPVH